jgi:hypothetical protein
MIISDLKPSILSITPEAQYSLIRELRALRRELKPVKPRKTKKKAAPKKKAFKQLSLDEMLTQMSPQQAKELLAKLKQKG